MGQKPVEDEELDITPIEDEELDIIPAKEEELQITPRSTFSDIWHKANEPLTDLPSRAVAPIANAIDNPLGEGGMLKGFAAGALQGVGDLATSLTSPINLMGTVLTGGSGLAAKAGLGGISRGLNIAANTPVIAGGAQDISEGNYGTGALEMAGGLLGLKTPPTVKLGGSNAAQLGDKPALNLPTTVKIKRPSSELLNKLRGQGYRLSHVGEDGYPVWKLTEAPTEIPGQKTGLLKEVYNLPRGLTTTMDLSAPMRQGLGLIHRKEWWTSFGDMVKSWGSQKAYQNVMDEIAQRPLFQEKAMDKFDNMGKFLGTKREQSFAQQAGLALTDTVTKREENLIGSLPERVPLFGRAAKASNRAYTAYLNKLRADTFENLVKSMGAENNLPMAKEIANFVNTATGRGSLGAFEKNAELLTNTLFSPRLVASRMRMLNPGTYVMANPQVRKEYLKSMLAIAGSWGTVAGLSQMAGADVSWDPTNSDFGKVKIGNTRLDPGGGFLQYLVAMARLAKGETTSSTTGNTRELGAKFGSPTRMDVATDFTANKLHPFLKFGYDMLNASKYRSVHMGDRIAQMFVPLIAQDMLDIAKDDPSLLPMAIPAALGMSTQTYDKGNKEGLIIPNDMDYVYKGGGAF